MKIQEAISCLKTDKKYLKNNNICDGKEIDVAIEALKKSIPKKTKKAIDRTWGIKEKLDVCPVCGCYIPKIYFFNDGKKEPCKKMSYCEHCGQAILWEE